MAKYRLNQILLFVLIVAFLGMQSAAAHIHLASQHDHDGSHHQHYSETHAHPSIDAYDSVGGFSHSLDHANTVALDYECSITQKNQQDPPGSTAAITASMSWSLPFRQRAKVVLPIVVSAKLSYFYRSSAPPRAPPQFS